MTDQKPEGSMPDAEAMIEAVKMNLPQQAKENTRILGELVKTVENIELGLAVLIKYHAENLEGIPENVQKDLDEWLGNVGS